ncbi:apoptosis-inducing factor 1, mitochondrial isoform X2 [Anthonomus grandis grandis]|uniref:apoptosis-inducing factor 1, mitochondrial isoform X2 n=1 Tax=Anthonomus grandis grandis TaxID=2921223 RepID=UPI0021666E80|nr:apoptosis-inducing factor 1, mitochondrial isoform X2 [Anthonomus grandis grandis]
MLRFNQALNVSKHFYFRNFSSVTLSNYKPSLSSLNNLKSPQIAASQQKHFSSDSDKKKTGSSTPCNIPSGMDRMPQPEGAWDEHERKHKAKGRKFLLLGLLATALSIGTIYYLDKKRVPQKQTQAHKKKAAKAAASAGITKIPPSSDQIPKDIPYLLIGGGTASFTAFRAIKSSDPTAKVLIISNEPYYPYMRPPLSKEIWFNEDNDVSKRLIFKQWNGSERSLFYEPDDFYIECENLMKSENGGVAVARGWSVSHLDVMEKLAYLDDGSQIKYNKCLIATGSTPRLSPVFEVAVADDNLKNQIKVFRNIDDFKDMLDSFEEAKSVAVIGGGFLGSELACAFGRKDKKKNKDIYQIFRETGNMGRILPEYLSLWTSQKVRAEGVQVVPNTEIVGVKSKNNRVELTLSSGKTVMVDFVIVAVGVEANTDLAEKSDLEVDPELGGYLVNTELQARTDLYIAGDCACFYDPRLGRRRIEHHDHAVVSGRLAGENMAGARNPYEHQSMFWSDLGPEVGYEAIGIVDSKLPTVGVFAKQTNKDTPQAVVEQTGEGDRSKTEELPQECEKYLSEEEKAKLKESRKLMPNPREGEDYGKGVIFYLRNDIVVGIVLWNVFNRMSIARQVLKEQKKYDDLNEVAKLFNIHEDE